jgi:hypothetical protein
MRVLLGPGGGAHLKNMAFPPAPERFIRLFPRRQPWPRQVFASSLALHAVGFALVGWATHGKFRELISTSSQQVTRAYAVSYLVLNGAPARPGARHERRPPGLAGPVAPVRASPTPLGGVTVVGTVSQSTLGSAPPSAPENTLRSAPPQPALQAEALAPGAIAGIGQLIPTTHSDSTGGRGLAGMLGFRAPEIGVDSARRGLDRLPELMGGTGTACPELQVPAASTKPQTAVAVTFVVDTNGTVDPATLQVIESPGQPRTDRRFHARVYVVGASALADSGRSPPAADDSALTEEVASHVADLVFRPALRRGRAIRSSVMVSCQTS